MKQKEIKTRNNINNNVQVLSGLQAGDVILTEGFQYARNGMTIKTIYN